ncbi:hypothetical protein LINGRAPRIM_LOCUS554, partial [Linum grandiflorum]
ALSKDIRTPVPSQASSIQVGANDISLGIKNGVRFLHTSDEFRAKLCAPLQKALVIRLMGKSVGIQYMYDRLLAMWRPEGRLRMVDLDNYVFLATFDNPHDYDNALTGGPWMMLDHYLVVHSWDPSFRVSSNLPAKMVVWARFPKLHALPILPQRDPYRLRGSCWPDSSYRPPHTYISTGEICSHRC